MASRIRQTPTASPAEPRVSFRTRGSSSAWWEPCYSSRMTSGSCSAVTCSLKVCILSVTINPLGCRHAERKHFASPCPLGADPAAMSPEPAIQVGIDARCLNTRHVRGMGKYVLEMLSHATGEEHIRWRLLGDRSDMPLHCPAHLPAEIELFDWKGYRFKTWEQFGLPWRARRAGLDVLHCTATTLPYWQPVPVMVTLHDTLPWQDKEVSGYESWYWHRLVPAALHRSWAIITISEASRRDILALWPRLGSKLHVIPHGVGDSYLDAQAARPERLPPWIGPERYLLYVGGVIERKRFSWAARILGELGDLDVRLVACGFAPEEAREAVKALKPELRERVRFAPFVPEAEMPALYQNAAAVLYPTLYEGFGFPALEAQAVGTPVLFSALGSLQELVGPGAIILPPNDLTAWVEAVRTLLLREHEDTTRVLAARSWARQFSWHVSAEKHLALYELAARHSRTRRPGPAST
jgi:glycosyltransferase involved in cell wall biosynthesis